MPHFQHIRPSGPAALLLAALAVAGCGRASDRDRFHGHVPAKPANVAGILLREVGPGGGERPFALRAQPGGVLLAFFGFANCPDICPATLSDVAKALRALGPDAARIEVAFITVDPARDSAAALARYLASFLRGGHALRPSSQAELGAAEAAFGAVSKITRTAGGEPEVSHTPLLYAVDERGDLKLQWDFGTPPDVLAADIRLLLGGRGAAPAAVLEVRDAWAAATPAGAPAGAVYFTVVSPVPDRLIGASVPPEVAAKSEMHGTTHGAGGTMTMRKVRSLDMAAGEALAFAPGGYHVMLLGLAKPLAVGDTISMELRFDRARWIPLRVPVRER